MITQRLTGEEIFQAQFCWASMEDASYLKSVLDYPTLLPYFLDLRNHRTIEIGSGDNPINNHYPCREYVSAEGFYPKDGLSVLKKEGDESAAVVAFGVIDDCILKSFSRKREGLAHRYIEELVEEIKRVMSPFAIIIGLDAQKYMGIADVSMDTLGGVYIRKHQG